MLFLALLVKARSLPLLKGEFEMNTNPLVCSLLTDAYTITMAYADWKQGRNNDEAVFELFFRKNPFGGAFTVFAGLEEVLEFVKAYRFTDDDIEYIRSALLPGCEEEFFDWLKSLDCSAVRIYAIKEGSLVFPRVPLLCVKGPIAICRLLETPLLNLINYPSLIATLAARHRLAAGDAELLEFGLRRSQGPDGGLSASRYSYIGGFDGTSNVLAGKMFGIPVRGTMAHAFVQSYISLQDLKSRLLINSNSCADEDFVQRVLEIRKELGFTSTNEGELAAFIAYAQAFPNKFLALVDTYDTLKSGVPNFICVAAALGEFGYHPLGIRLDSGDLDWLAKKARHMMNLESGPYTHYFAHVKIVASNDINEEILRSLRHNGSAINSFGIGTNLVTCQAQPALGCVYKLVSINGKPRIKLSENTEKITIPGEKAVYRLKGDDGRAILDLITEASERPPRAREQIICYHPFDPMKRQMVVPTDVVCLHSIVWDGRDMRGAATPPTLKETRQYVLDQLSRTRPDHLRVLNPTPYKVSISSQLHNKLNELWALEAPLIQIK